jgi:hypothetical protein
MLKYIAEYGNIKPKTHQCMLYASENCVESCIHMTIITPVNPIIQNIAMVSFDAWAFIFCKIIYILRFECCVVDSCIIFGKIKLNLVLHPNSSVA